MNKLKITAAACLWAISSIFVSSAYAKDNSAYAKIIVDRRNYENLQRNTKSDFSLGFGIGVGYRFKHFRIGFERVVNKANTLPTKYETYSGFQFDGIIKASNDINIFVGLNLGQLLYNVDVEILDEIIDFDYKVPKVSFSVGAEYAINRYIQAEIRSGTEAILGNSNDPEPTAYANFTQIGITSYF